MTICPAGRCAHFGPQKQSTSCAAASPTCITSSPATALVVWTAGNVSARVPGHDLMVIKPSGVPYDELTAASMVVTDLFGALVEGEFAPSSDTAAHAYVYRHMPDVGGVVHTHSTYATHGPLSAGRFPAC